MASVGFAQTSVNLKISGTVDPVIAVSGGDVTYVWTVTNQGSTAATGVSLIATPGAANVTSVNATQGTSCMGGTTVYCSLGTIDAGASAEVTAVARTMYATQLFTYAVVTANETDLDSSDNTMTLWTPVMTASQYSLASWGLNANGQLGDGTTYDQYSPVAVNLTGVVAVSAGYRFTLALKNDGTVWSWGEGSNGQLGDGTQTAIAPVPVQVSGLSAVVAISAGLNHAMALKNDGTVWTWGANTYGQLGNRSTSASLTPVRVLGLDHVISIAAGYEFSLALKDDGTLWSWGDNSNGFLGDGTYVMRTVPVEITTLSGVVLIAAGGDQAFALLGDGSLWGWGFNVQGQLGIGSLTPTDSNVPVQVKDPSGTGYLSDVVAIASGTDHTLVVKSDGTVWGWGDGLSARLGANAAPENPLPIQIAGLENIIRVAAGSQHNLAIKIDGSVWAWGSNANGQLGYGESDSATPVNVSSITSAASVAAGASHSLALSGTGTVSCVTPPAGLFNWWRAEGDTADFNGGAAGVAVNGTSYATGRVGQAFDFSGNAQHIELPDSVVLGHPAWTVETWFKTSSGGVILGLQDGTYGSELSTYDPLLFVGVNGQLSGGIWPVQLASQSSVNDGQWHHAAITYDNGTVEGFLDGLSVGGGTALPQYIPVTQIGSGYTVYWTAGNNGWFDFVGQVDEFAIFGRALTQQEIQSIYNAGTAGMCQVPVPTVAALSPDTAAAGGAGFSLNVTGTNFTATSVVLWNGMPRATTYISGTELEAIIPATDSATESIAEVSVRETAAGGSSSLTLPFTITAATVADLSVTEWDANETLVVGANYTFSYVVANAGPATATNVVLVPAIPYGATLVSVTPSGTSWSCDANGKCTLASLAANDSATVEYTCKLNVPGPQTYSAVVSSAEIDSDTSNNVTSETNTVLSIADVSVSVGPATLGSNNVHVHTVDISNAGPYDANNVTFTDTMTGDTAVSATASQGSCRTTAQFVTCSLGAIVANTSVRVQISAQAPSSGWSSHAFNASAQDIDPYPVNNSVRTSNESDLNTRVGANVVVAASDPTTGTITTVSFATVTQPGTTAVSVGALMGTVPPGFRTGATAVMFDVRTSAAYAGALAITVPLNAAAFHHPTRARLFHFENGAWVDRTSGVDLASGRITAVTTSLSPFAVFEPANAVPVANAGGDAIFPGTTAAGASVALDATASQDSDGDPLTYRWTGPFPEGGGNASGVKPSVKLPFGVSKITLVVNDGENDSAPVAINVTVSDFEIASTTPSAVVDAGGAAQYAIALSPKFGTFTAPVTLACGNVPLGMTCSFAPAVVTPGASGGSVKLTVSTSPFAALAPHSPHGNSPWRVLAVSLCPFGLVLFGAADRRRRRWLVAGLLLVLLAMGGCGGSAVVSTAPASHTATTSTISVTASAGGLSHTTTVSLTVR